MWALDLSSSGHFTAMQVRDRQTLGMEFHLDRLEGATRELFGIGLDGDRVRDYIRHALADDTADASVRVNVFRPGADDDVSVVVSVRPPAPRRPIRRACRRWSTGDPPRISSALPASGRATTRAWPTPTVSMKPCSWDRTAPSPNDRN